MAVQEWDDQLQPSIRARLWVDGERDFYRGGDRLRLRFSTSRDAHVALIHVDPDGRLEILFPSSPWESDLVRGGRTHSLPRAYQAGLPVHGRSGIGYIYLIASPVPLDYRHFSSGRGGGWDWSYAGRNVIGDPFWAMEQITRLMVPEYAPYGSDYYSYYVGGRHQYPTYACADGYRGTRGGWGWSSSYGSCSRLDLFLRQHPFYYDARRYRGDRRGHLARAYGPPAVQHRYKEAPVSRAGARAPGQPTYRAPEQPRREQGRASSTDDRAPAVRQPARRPPAARQPQRSAEPRQSPPAQRQRPTLERRSPPRPSGSQGKPSATQGERRRPTPAPAARSNERRSSAPAARSGAARESAPSGSSRSRRPPDGD